MMHKKHSAIKLALSVCVSMFFASLVQAAGITFPVEVGERPESITKGFKGSYYITRMNKKVEGDAEVVVLTKGGVKVFAKGFDEPKGIVYLKKHLYISDLTRVWKIDKKGRGTVFAKAEDFPFPVSYLNDVAVAPDKKGIFITDMGAVKYMRGKDGKLFPTDSPEAKKIPQEGRVYHIDLKGKVTLVVGPSPLMLNPNGVGVANDGSLLITSFFMGHVLNFKNGKLNIIGEAGKFRGADAIEQDKQGNFYVSSWSQGKVWKIDGKTFKSKELISGMQSSADFYLEERKKRLLVPDMLAGTVQTVSIE